MSSLKSIRKRDKRVCWLCGHKVSDREASRDHVEPNADGGTMRASNLRLAHRQCNRARNRLPETWVESIVKPLKVDGASTQEVAEALAAGWQEYVYVFGNETRPTGRERRRR